jgi:2-polyprenyl-3-methyl-5-hydroxy-6-metoxy-1,4-benzoquinol methylase
VRIAQQFFSDALMNKNSALARKVNEALGAEVLQRHLDSPLSRAKSKKLFEIISSLSKKDMLADVGCFDGSLFETYESCGVSQVDGYDIIPTALDEARASHPNSKTALWDFEVDKSPAHDSSYDIIVCADVIEHLFDPSNLVSECFRILKEGGVCIFLTPNLASLWNRYLLLRGRVPLGHPGVAPMFKEDRNVNPGHSRIGTAIEWKSFLRAKGFVVSKVDGIWASRFSRIIALDRPSYAHTLVFVCSKSSSS